MLILSACGMATGGRVVHGERRPAGELRKRIDHELGWRARVPDHGSTWST